MNEDRILAIAHQALAKAELSRAQLRVAGSVHRRWPFLRFVRCGWQGAGHGDGRKCSFVDRIRMPTPRGLPDVLSSAPDGVSVRVLDEATTHSKSLKPSGENAASR